MTPAARIAAAIGVLDRILSGQAGEVALSGWARANRYAGSGDRAAVRDHVFDGLRHLRSHTARSGATDITGRAVMIGACLAAGADLDILFSGVGYGPEPLSASERATLAGALRLDQLAAPIRLDCPDWLYPIFASALGDACDRSLSAMQARAAVYLRLNTQKAKLPDLLASLASDGIVALPVDGVSSAVEVTDNASKIKNCTAYLEGLCELQDASPQAAVLDLPLREGDRVLDYCAGGGGKILAIAARMRGTFVAHDAAPARMVDLPRRALRADAKVVLADTADLATLAPFDLVVADVPCSGTGTWRRTPDAKWKLDAGMLVSLARTQDAILDEAAGFVAENGHLAYMTCSLLPVENHDRIAAFVTRNAGWRCLRQQTFLPHNGGDGFFTALLTRA